MLKDLERSKIEDQSYERVQLFIFVYFTLTSITNTTNCDGIPIHLLLVAGCPLLGSPRGQFHNNKRRRFKRQIMTFK